MVLDSERSDECIFFFFLPMFIQYSMNRKLYDFRVFWKYTAFKKYTK